MGKLKILLATPLDDNPYIIQLIRSLQLNPEVDFVQHGLQWLRDTKINFDVVHIQWPEALLNWKEPNKNSIRFLKNTFSRWKQNGTRIVATVHNSFPHNNINEYTYDLYHIVYNNCDSVIHLGEESIKILRDKIDYSLPREQEYVIPHGNYEWFENSVNRETARKWLKIDKEKKVVLCIGEIRNLDEIKLLKQAAEYLMSYNAILLVAGRLPNSSRKSISHYTVMLPFLKKKNVKIHKRYIPDKEMQYYLNAADILFIPRIDSLNSGNVALGFTFGKVVIGPNYGVIGEELNKLGNPVFDPQSDDSLKMALKKSFQLIETSLGGKNKTYAFEELDWTLTAQKHVDVYKQLLE